MTILTHLAEWTLRSAILIAAGGLLLQALRVKDAAIRLAAWIALLCGSLLIPALMASLPPLPVSVIRVPASAATVILSVPLSVSTQLTASPAPSQFHWAGAALLVYATVAFALLLRLGIGLWLSRRVLRSARPTGRMEAGCEIRESDRVASPVTMGIVRPVIVLPADWREWDALKLTAVLAHERAHIHRRDPTVQVLSALHRALLWHSPLSWVLHRQIVRTAEEASDDAAVAATRDRASYAETLLDFVRRGVRGANWQGVAMARYENPEKRIHRILDAAELSRGVTRWSMAAILLFGSPLAYVVAAAHPQHAPQAPVAPTALQAPVAPSAPSAAIRRYTIFDGDSISGSWDSNDQPQTDALKARFGSRFVWFRQNGGEFVITDAGVLSELHQAMEPQKEVNRKQEAVNRLQSAVNAQQTNVNRQQEQVNRHQSDVNRMQSNRGDQDAINREQSVVNAEQSKVNDQQHEVNAQQSKVNEEQHKVNDEQHLVSEIYSRRIREIFDSAVRRKLVQQII